MAGRSPILWAGHRHRHRHSVPSLPGHGPRHRVLQTVTDACESLLATTVDSDLRWALTLPDRLRRLDMEDIGSSTVTGTVGDQSATDDLWVASMAAS